MLGIRRRNRYKWRNNYQWMRTAVKALPHFTLETVLFGRYTIYDGKVHKSYYPWKVSLAGLGTCLVILLSFGRLDCNWLQRTREK